MRFARGFARFWWDFIVGDDWRIAAGVVTVLAAGALLVAVGIVAVAIGSIVASALRARRR